MAIARMDQGKIKVPKLPLWHDPHQPALAQQARFHNRRKITDTYGCKQRRRKSGIIVY